MKCRSILVVEDDEAIRLTIVELLLAESYGIPIYAAPDGVAGLRSLEGVEKPCLVLLDIMMPGKTGWDFLSDIEKSGLVHECYVVIITASCSAKSTAYPVIHKPMELGGFLDLVRKICVDGLHPLSPTSAQSISP